MSILVVGAGVSGSAALQLLTKRNIPCALFEERELSAEVKGFIDDNKIPHYSQNPDDLSRYNALCLSPGIPFTNPLVVTAQKLGLEITNDVNIARNYFSGEIIGVTGTNGKSTVTSLLAHMLTRAGVRSEAGGNIGISPATLLCEKPLAETWVLELSSYQLETVRNLKPVVAIWTTFAGDHLARHGSLRNYFIAKWRLVEELRPGSLLITTAEILALSRGHGLPLDPKIRVALIETADSPTLGADACCYTLHGQSLHCSDGSSFLLPAWDALNSKNLAMCVAAVREFRPLAKTSVLELCADFTFLPYRYQRLQHRYSKAIINDSKSTNVESAVAAIGATPGLFYLLCGGAGKGESYSVLHSYGEQIVWLFCFGGSGAEIKKQAGLAHSSYHASLGEAVAAMICKARKTPETILFSPACASFDEFKNFEERGSFFTKAMEKL